MCLGVSVTEVIAERGWLTIGDFGSIIIERHLFIDICHFQAWKPFQNIFASVLLISSFGAPAKPPEVWEQHERDGHMPKFPDCPVCVEEHGSVVRHFASTSSSLHTLHLDTGYWEDLSLDGKGYYVVAGLCAQHDDKVILLPFFIPVDNKSGLLVWQEVFQLIDYIASCKQFQAFHSSKVFHILSEQGTEFVNQDFEKHSRQCGIRLSTSPAHQPQSNGVAKRLPGLTKTMCKMPSSCTQIPRHLLELCNEVCSWDVATQGFWISMACPSIWWGSGHMEITW